MQTVRPTDLLKERKKENASIIVRVLMAMSIPTAALFTYYGYLNQRPSLYIPAALLFATIAFSLFTLGLVRRGQVDTAMTITIGIFLVNIFSVVFIVKGLAPIAAGAVLVVLLSIAWLALTPKYSIAGLISALGFAFLVILVDILLGPETRTQVSQLEQYTPYILLAITVPIILLLIREFNNFGLQIKITIGVLITGGITVATLALFVLNSTSSILGSLSTKYEEHVTESTETQIFNTVQAEADKTSLLFEEIINDLREIAEYRSNLDAQSADFSDGNYWNATEHLFRLSGGQYGNSRSDPASVFIPSLYPPNEKMLSDLNISSYLNFLAPGFLASHPNVSGIHYTSAMGYLIYYPNSDITRILPADFDPMQQMAYQIAAPDQNPERQVVWSKPYQDPAGTGLIVTASYPVYSKNGKFLGVAGANIQLTSLLAWVSSQKLGENDLAFLVDKNGIILAMSDKGYDLFGLEPEILKTNETAGQTILDTKSEIMLFAAQRIVISRSNLLQLPINGVDSYLAIASLTSTDYKLVIFAPASELNNEIIASRTEIQKEVDQAVQNATLILVALFLGALLVSLFVGQIITQPLKRLTSAVEGIAGGNLSTRVDLNSQDETGMLARSFNSMADRLSETLNGLEERISDRTRQLEKINENNIYRAAQFESIARIASIISSTQTLDRLLPQITETISERFNFYHVGIFLLDVHKEYAVLAAANSEGGKRMLERNHRLRVGETGIVGFVTHSGQPRVALDVGKDSVFFNNPDLSETHSEIALPLQVGTEIIGALDVQSTVTNAFSQEDVNILAALADQVSIAIQNARSYQQSREALEQAEIASAQLSEQQWRQFLGKQSLHGYHFDGVDAKRLSANSQKPSHSIAIPLILRGTQIGTLKLSSPNPMREWSEDEIAVAQATAERTALAIENARLLQEAQKRASKESTISQISAKIGSLVNLDNIIQTTVQELGNTLPGTDVAIQFLSGRSDHQQVD